MASTYALPEELTIYTATELKPQLLAWLQTSEDDGQMLTLDGQAVAEADGAGIQLLVALQHTATGMGKPLHWSGSSQTLRAACTDLGCATYLGLNEGEST